MKKSLFKLTQALLGSAVIFMSGCSLLSVYRIDLPQGTPLTQMQVQKLKVGMSVAQVQYILGSPAVVDSLSPREWHYIYDYHPGTYGKKYDVPAVHQKQKLTVYFSEAGIVEKFTGQDSFPAEQKSLSTVLEQQ